MVKVSEILKPGVVSGDDLQTVFSIAKELHYAIPAVNVVSSGSVNAVLEAASEVKSPVIIQFSNGGAIFYAGKYWVRKAFISWQRCMGCMQ
jgi:fructose-bisphosphate aldolase, class II